MPPAVLAEVEEGRRRGIPLPDLTATVWIDVRVPQREVQGASLGPGEKAVLALAMETPDAIALLDDAVARRRATTLGIRFMGTLGVFLRSKRESLLGEVEPVLNRLDELGFRLDSTTRQVVLQLAGER